MFWFLLSALVVLVLIVACAEALDVAGFMPRDEDDE
jgi:hypothetical protein